MGIVMAARSRKVELDEEWRDRIKVGVLLNRLMNHAVGEIEMSNTQIKAAEILLRKKIPDLAAVAHSGEVTHKLTLADAITRITG